MFRRKFNLKPRPETVAIMDKLDFYEYATLWVDGVPRLTFKKGDGLWSVDRYVTKFIPEKHEYFVDGCFDKDIYGSVATE